MLRSLGDKRNFVQWLKRVAGTEWVVYAKPPFGGPRQVLKVGSSRVDLQACKLEYSIVSPK